MTKKKSHLYSDYAVTAFLKLGPGHISTIRSDDSFKPDGVENSNNTHFFGGSLSLHIQF